jgi:Domain of unknown function (DUF1906)
MTDGSRVLHRAGLCLVAIVATLAASLLAAPPGSAQPATTVRYARTGVTTTYHGLAFDTCTAPTLTTMQAWRASPYRALGIYISGANRGCAQPELTADWVRGVSRMGWRLLPIHMGRQAPCSTRDDSLKIGAARASLQGRKAARQAVENARALGLRRGSAVYVDMEHYATGVRRCRAVVLEYLSAWTRQMHRLGYLSGVYAHQDSGALHLAQTYDSDRYARPDALWIARWDRSDDLRGWPTVTDAQWARSQRAKQYRGDHLETWGGVTLNIDNDRLAAPVATVARSYRVTADSVVRSRRGPARSYRVVGTYRRGASVGVVCQTLGRRAGGSRVWDKLGNGSYVPDAFVDTPARKGFSRRLPRCRYAYQVRRADGTTVHRRPRATSPVVRSMPAGALTRVVCQRRVSVRGRTAIWDRLRTGRWVRDRHIATGGPTGFTRAIPRC